MPETHSRDCIYPTGTCFDDAMDFLELRLRVDPGLANGAGLLLVHGIATFTNGMNEDDRVGEPFAHAWVEEGPSVWQAGILDGQRVVYAVDRNEFYAEMKIVDATRYTIREVWEQNVRSEHYGPWEPRYEALTRDGKRVA